MRDILNEAWGPRHWDVILGGGRCCWVTERRQGSRKRARRMWHPNTLAWLGGRERLNALSILGSFLLLLLRSQIPRHTVALCTPLLSNHSTWTLMLSLSPAGLAPALPSIQMDLPPSQAPPGASHFALGLRDAWPRTTSRGTRIVVVWGGKHPS